MKYILRANVLENNGNEYRCTSFMYLGIVISTLKEKIISEYCMTKINLGCV